MDSWLLHAYLMLILGRPGYGKSTLAIRYLLNSPAAGRFIYDHQGRDGPRISSIFPWVRTCYTANELEASLPWHRSIFNPCRMFPDDLTYRKGFEFFGQWVYDACRRGPGKKYFLINEVNEFQDRDEISPKFAQLVLRSREYDIEPVLCAQRPHKVNDAITGAHTEVICFNVGESVEGVSAIDPALKKVESLGIAASEVRTLVKGQYIARNRDSGQIL